jgi:hypothetical protein
MRGNWGGGVQDAVSRAAPTENPPFQGLTSRASELRSASKRSFHDSERARRSAVTQRALPRTHGMTRASPLARQLVPKAKAITFHVFLSNSECLASLASFAARLMMPSLINWHGRTARHMLDILMTDPRRQARQQLLLSCRGQGHHRNGSVQDHITTKQLPIPKPSHPASHQEGSRLLRASN